MTEPDTPTPLHLHTLDSLCDELVSGRGVTTADGTVFRLDSDEARAAFQWYLDHQSEWAKNVRTADLEPRADAILVPPAVLPPATAPEPATRKPILHIQSLSTRRFGGIQRYDSDDFKHHFESPLTLIEGLNGSGKTSLLSAITWCLTGHCLRSQRPPEPVDGSKTVPVRSEAEFAEAPPFSEDILAITPLPPAGVVRALGDAPLPVDTRVTLRFADADGQPAGAMTRAVTRTPRGKVQTEVTRSPGLDLDPVATEIGTIMAGALPTLDLAKASDLGAAVASLTGLRPLQDLARHAARSETKYRKDLVQAREREIAELDQTYAASWSELANLLDEHPHLAPQTAAPPEPTALGAEDILARCTAEFDEMESAAFAASRAILGDSFNPADRAARDDIKDNVGPARGQTSNESLARLDSAQRLRCLAALTADDLATAADLVQRLTVEAGELAELARNEGLHARLRLYARVADWLQESADGPDGHLDQCPVCLTALAGKTDPVSGEPVAKHIESLLRSDGEYLQQSLAAWERRAGERLAAARPPALPAGLTRHLPERPPA
ncbi:AAA family ATPase, partial [bacterium]|nr:AAA family ATPase [bacterium]